MYRGFLPVALEAPHFHFLEQSLAAKKNKNKSKIAVPPNGHQKTKGVPFRSDTHQQLLLALLASFPYCREVCGGFLVRGSSRSPNLLQKKERGLLGSGSQSQQLKKAEFGFRGPKQLSSSGWGPS